MTEEQRIQYLANIFHVARADGRVDGVEDTTSEQIAEGIGGGYLETRKGLDLALEKDFAVQLPQRLSDRIRNLEDMFMLACCDQGFDAMEKEIIIDFAKQIGITQDQLNAIRREVKAELSQE